MVAWQQPMGFVALFQRGEGGGGGNSSWLRPYKELKTLATGSSQWDFVVAAVALQQAAAI